MKKICSTAIFTGACVATLLLAPSFMKAEVFGYAGIKMGYAYEMLPKTEFKTSKITHLDATTAVGLPLGLNIGVGYDFSPRFGMRMEAEYTYRFMGKFKEGALKDEKGSSILIAKPSIQFQSLLGNLYLDYYITPSINFYLSTGIGIGFFGTSTEFNTNGTIHNFVSRPKPTLNWQAGLGIGYALTESLGLDLNVRYMNFGKSSFEPQEEPIRAIYKFSAIEALVGLNYRF